MCLERRRRRYNFLNLGNLFIPFLKGPAIKVLPTRMVDAKATLNQGTRLTTIHDVKKLDLNKSEKTSLKQ